VKSLEDGLLGQKDVDIWRGGAEGEGFTVLKKEVRSAAGAG